MNYITIIVTAVILMAISSIWYSPKMFGKRWMKLVGLKPSDAKKADMGPLVVKQAIVTLVMLFVLSIFINLRGDITFIAGATTGALIWLGFVTNLDPEHHLIQVRRYNTTISLNATKGDNARYKAWPKAPLQMMESKSKIGCAPWAMMKKP